MTSLAPPRPPAVRAPDIAPRRTPGRRVNRFAPMVPALALLGIFFAGPMLWSVYTAFTNMALTGSSTVDFVGVDNFTRMLHDRSFLHSLQLTLIFVVGSAVIGQNTLGLLVALLLRGRSRTARSVVTGLIIAAWAVPETVAGFCWYAFLYRTGTLNALLGHLGVAQNWLYTAPMLAVIIANVWRGTAFSMLVYSAALSEIPPDVVEAASMDGASGWQRLRHITLPLIRRAIVSNLMLITLQTLAAFGLIFVMTGGGPGTASQTTPLYMYQQSFKFYQLGYGTAMALVLLAVGALFSALYLRLIRLEEA
jgi:multiple sugar transport system permease protein